MRNATKSQHSTRRQIFFHGKSCKETSAGTTKGPIQSKKRKKPGKIQELEVRDSLFAPDMHATKCVET